MGPPLGGFKLVFVCDQTGLTGFWQHPISGARTRSGGALTQRFVAQDRDKVRDALTAAERSGRGSFVAALEGGVHTGTLVEIHLERMQMGARRLLLGFTQMQPHRATTDKALEGIAGHDSLSGLPNRFMLMDRLAQAVEHAVSAKAPMALLYLDIDNFALVNTSFGTAVGDEVLRKLAHRLEETVAGWGEAFHLGSDGFGVLLAGITSKNEALEMAQSIIAGLEAPLQAANQSLYLSASIGIAMAPPDRDAQMVFRHAGQAMHAAMRRGAGSVEYYAGAENDSSESLRLATGLRQAMEHGELFLHYQPYFDLYTGQISGAEALVRWQHPELGLIPPARFIPVAEETGHIVRLGEWVLKSACLQMRAWQDAGLQGMHMAVNISARQLRQQDFLDRLMTILDETGLLPGNLVLELTESSMMDSPERAREVFSQLHDAGVGIAIDDFGTGYSSLNYLRQYQVDYLKVDQAFVSNLPHDEHQQAIMRAIIAMAKSLDIQVIAEGVETAAQCEFLKMLECEQGQGFLFARPQPAADIEELIRAGAMLPGPGR